MTRKIVPVDLKAVEDSQYTYISTGGPGKYYNRRRVRKLFAPKIKIFEFQPVTTEWFTFLIQKIGAARRRQRISQMTLAGILGTTQAAISRLETGRANPTVELIDRILTVLKLDLKLIISDKTVPDKS